ncbi:NAD(P)-binding domain-containing protein [Marinibaculum pumilum]|uniref:NAD(P)-binding domain-containing protein n=1 Tax=Marinibaculum pumilum TaxID=1766165 RepID=A0ABV7L8N3_9PROT
MTGPDPAAGLAALEAALARDFDCLNHPPAPWTPEHHGPDGRPAADVLIVGGGMNGLAAAFALRRLGLSRLRQVDRRPAGQEGPWLTYARMELLRSPKHLTGPALGLPNLTFRAWWEAQHGAAGWERLGHIRRQDWAAYLGWYGRVTGAAVESGTRLLDLAPAGQVIAARLRTAEGAEEVIHARQVVLATGREGQARARIPAAFVRFQGARVRHSSDPLDPATLPGRRVVVIGLSASAFDNACVAAEAGAQVTLLGRAASVPTVNKMKQTVYPGFAQGFPDLPDAERLAWLRLVARARIAPPRHTVQRAVRAGVRLVTGAPVQAVRDEAGILRIETAAGSFGADLVVLGTGFRFDLSAAPELGGFAARALTWRDVLPGVEAAEEEEQSGDDLLDCPALGPGFELRPRPGAAREGLDRLRIFTHAAQPSLGNLANDIPQASEGADRLARAVARALFLEDMDWHRTRLAAYADPELLGDEGLLPWLPGGGS